LIFGFNFLFKLEHKIHIEHGIVDLSKIFTFVIIAFFEFCCDEVITELVINTLQCVISDKHFTKLRYINWIYA
jgi:hypothetical protein